MPFEFNYAMRKLQIVHCAKLCHSGRLVRRKAELSIESAKYDIVIMMCPLGECALHTLHTQHEF